MSTFNFTLPEINQETLSDSRNIKAIYDALYMLNEQLRFALSNLSIDENFDDQTEGVINKVAKEIHLYAKKGELSAELSLEDGLITLLGNRIIIDSDNFKVLQDGTITAVNGNFSGNIGSSGIISTLSGVGSTQIIGGILLNIGGQTGNQMKMQEGILTIENNQFVKSTYDAFNIHLEGGINHDHHTYYGLYLATIDGALVMTQSNVNSYVIHPESDLRIKKDIISAPDKWLNVLAEVKVKEFTFKDNTSWGDHGQRHVGLIAQQVQKVLEDNEADTTELVYRKKIIDEQKLDTKEYTHGEDPLAVDYNQFIPMLIMGYQKLLEKTEALEKEIEILKGGKEK